MNETRFEFGKNWSEYSASVDDSRIEIAMQELSALLPDLKGKSFLDIGSGSGLHSLAALRLGASNVVAIDYDKNSVSTTKAVLSRFAPEGPWEAGQGDILNPTLTGTFDVVYSWGVLHHTGDMWAAIENASMFCKPNGEFAIALYVKTPMCGLWKTEKRLYCDYPVLRPLMRVPYTGLLLARQSLANRSSPQTYLKDYKAGRGMDFFVDIKDWLGGYPYESVSHDELMHFLEPKGFTFVRSRNTKAGVGLFGTGCGEWVFTKHGKAY